MFAQSLTDIADPTAKVAEQRAILATLLLRGHLSHFVALHREPFVFEPHVTARPEANVLARILAPRNHSIPSRRHKLVPMQPPARALLTLLDGTRDAPQLVAALMSQAAEDSPADVAAVTAYVQEALTGFARQGLLIG